MPGSDDDDTTTQPERIANDSRSLPIRRKHWLRRLWGWLFR